MLGVELPTEPHPPDESEPKVISDDEPPPPPPQALIKTAAKDTNSIRLVSSRLVILLAKISRNPKKINKNLTKVAEFSIKVNLVNLFYAKTAAMETFTVLQSDRHPTDMAMLQGARMVFAQEPEATRAWTESKIKSLTGGDPISARFMRQDFFEFVPRFKLLISGNHLLYWDDDHLNERGSV